MSKGPLLLWLVMELGWLFLTPTASEVTVKGILGQSVTLPCLHATWSPTRNSMCWGKGSCPKSKCGQELLHTDGAAVTSRKSARYDLQGNIQGGDVSLTISKTNKDDNGVYCCRIEVPGWFNDVKKKIRLVLRTAPQTTTTFRPTTTPRVMTTTTPHVITTTSLHVTTATTMLPTTVVTTPDPTTGTPPQTMVTSALTMTANTCPLTMSSSLPEGSTSLLTTEPFTEEPVITEESETLPVSSDSPRRSTEAPSKTPSLLTAGDQHLKTLIIAAVLSFLLLLSLVLAFLLRGKVTESNCLPTHKRLDHTGESKIVLNDTQHSRDDEDGLFTL